MPDLEVRLFGEVSIQRGGRPLSVRSGKALELLCYLLVHRARAHSREALAEVLWPGREPEVAKKYLRQALWRLNQTVGCGSRRADSGQLLVVDSDRVRINADSSCWLDVRAFEQAYISTRDTAGQRLTDEQANRLEAATDLYRGDLLGTWYHDWCGPERDRLRLAYLAMLDQLIGYCEARRLFAKGLSLGQLVLQLDPTRESTHRELMRLHYRAGDRIAAMRQYERCVAVMAAELGVRPSASTVVLYAQIRADRVPDLPDPAEQPAAWDTPTEVNAGLADDAATVANLYRRLDQIQASLRALHESLLQGISTLSEPVRRTSLDRTARPVTSNGTTDGSGLSVSR